MGPDAKTPKIRELFIEELEQVQGGTGGPLEKLKEAIKDPPIYTTLACGEESPC